MTSTFAQEAIRQFAPWSHSKLELAEKCPKAFHKRHILRTKRVEGTEARVGTASHAYMENRLGGADKADAGTKALEAVKGLTTTEIETLNERNEQSERYVARIAAYRANRPLVHEGHEVDLAIRIDGSMCGYEDADAFLRGSVDHLMEEQGKKAVVVDHKTGKEKPIEQYRPQLDSYKVLTIQNRLHLNVIQAGVHHVQSGSIAWQRSVPRKQVQLVLLPWLLRRVQTIAGGLEGFVAKTSTLCAWCDYHTSCEEGLALFSLEKAAEMRAKAAARRLPKQPRIKKDGTPYATRAKNIDAVRPEELESASSLYDDVDNEIIL